MKLPTKEPWGVCFKHHWKRKKKEKEKSKIPSWFTLNNRLDLPPCPLGGPYTPPYLSVSGGVGTFGSGEGGSSGVCGLGVGVSGRSGIGSMAV